MKRTLEPGRICTDCVDIIGAQLVGDDSRIPHKTTFCDWCGQTKDTLPARGYYLVCGDNELELLMEHGEEDA